MVKVKSNQCALSGYVGGIWDKASSSFQVKRGATKNGKKYQIFEIKVSSKDKETGSYTNGKGIKVMLWGEVPIEAGQEIGIVGKFQPDNWTPKDSEKEVRGNMFNAFADDIFTPDSWDSSNSEPKEEVAEDEIPW